MSGYFALIITAHVPYLRAAGPRPEGEDPLHELIADALVPLLNTLEDLRALGVPVRLGLACSPLLLEQLADPVVQKHFVLWMDRRVALAQEDMAEAEQRGDQHRSYLARFALDWALGIQGSFIERYGRNLVAALRARCAEGLVEPLAGAATHAYLPQAQDETLRAQLELGALTTTLRLGQRPHGFWLPECAYHPRLNRYLAACDVRYVVLDPSSLNEAPDQRPYRLQGTPLAGLVRDTDLTLQIWSPDLGYIGDPLYRDLRRDPRSGLAYWRRGVHGPDEPYDPYHAFRRAREHAAHFAQLVGVALEQEARRHDTPGLITLTCDAALLGAQWFEGMTWLRALVEEIARSPGVVLTTPGGYLRAHPASRSVPLRPGDWSDGPAMRDWSGAATVPLNLALLQAEERLAELVRATPHAHGDQERALAQAVRELLLAQSSDWSFLLTQLLENPDARERPLRHLARCERLCDLAAQPALSEADLRFLDEVEELDNPFPNLNYRVFVA